MIGKPGLHCSPSFLAQLAASLLFRRKVRHRFHCLFCHGFEEKGVPSAGVLAVGDIANPQMALHLARMAKRLTGKVTVYTDGATSLAEQLDGMAVDGEVVVERRAIARLEKSSHGTDVIVHFKDGEKVTEGFLVKDTPLLALEV